MFNKGYFIHLFEEAFHDFQNKWFRIITLGCNQKDDLEILTDLYTVLLAEFGKNN